MLTFFAAIDWLAIAGWGGAGLLAAAAVWAYFALPTARWAWKALGVGAAVLVTLMLFRGALQKAEARGYDRAQVEAAQAAAAATIAMRAEQDRAIAAASARRKATEARLAPIRERAREYAQTADNRCPSPAGRLLIDEAIRAANDPAAATKR